MLRVASVLVLSLFVSTPLAGEVSPGAISGPGPRGVIVPTEQATLAIEFAAVVRRIYFREGQVFKKGARLIEFDCRRQQAEFKSARAQHREMLLTLESNVYLAGRGALGQHETEISKTRVERAAAEAEALKLQLEQCQIDAPFAGSVADLSVFEHEMPAPGKPFLKIIKSGALEIKLIVPSRWLVWLRRGQKFEFAVDETAKSYPAKVMRISTEVDPVSQTVEIFGRLAQGTDVLVGMSGIARFKQSRGQPDDRASE